MPLLIINTNVPKDKIPADFSKKITSLVSESLAKPELYVAVMINAGADLIWGGTDQPAAICHLGSIGKISKDQNKQTSKAIQSAIEQHLGISTSRQYLVFENHHKENVGYQATTFDDLI